MGGDLITTRSGWRIVAMACCSLLQKPDLILLDEPTNHLDIESVVWLEDFLINSAKAVMVISHDKAFVDNITNRTIEVTMGRIYDYKVNYSHYLELRLERRQQQQKAVEVAGSVVGLENGEARFPPLPLPLEIPAGFPQLPQHEPEK